MRDVWKCTLIRHVSQLHTVWIYESAVLVAVLEYVILALVEDNTLRHILFDLVYQLIEYIIALFFFFLLLLSSQWLIGDAVHFNHMAFVQHRARNVVVVIDMLIKKRRWLLESVILEEIQHQL